MNSDKEKITKTPEEWAELLSEESYFVTRERALNNLFLGNMMIVIKRASISAFVVVRPYLNRIISLTRVVVGRVLIRQHRAM